MGRWVVMVGGGGGGGEGGGIEIYSPLRKGKDRCFDEDIEKDT